MRGAWLNRFLHRPHGRRFIHFCRQSILGVLAIAAFTIVLIVLEITVVQNYVQHHNNIWVGYDKIEEREYSVNETKETWPIILYWGNRFGEPWSKYMGDDSNLKAVGCPEYRCRFTYNRSKIHDADLVIIPNWYNSLYKLPPTRGNSHQRWAYVTQENPYTVADIVSDEASTVMNWIMTYHSKADVTINYGYFVPHDSKQWPLQAQLMDKTSATYKAYMKALSEGKTLDEIEVPVRVRKNIQKIKDTFTSKTSFSALITSHCNTSSRRLEIVKLMNDVMDGFVDVYGDCGTMRCKTRDPLDPWCWENVLNKKYFFYFSMENALCDEYITEKLYNPLKYGLVPIVYGGADYNKFLPPHSYINVREHTPQSLHELLTQIVADPQEYERYHLWRAFWDVTVGGNICEICNRVHTAWDEPITFYRNIRAHRLTYEKCGVPPDNIQDILGNS